MNQQKNSVFVIKKFHSILKASIVVEAVSFIVTLTDSLIAGNLIGSEALVAIGLITPLSSLVTFIASIINSGTLLLYNSHTGRYEKDQADDSFRQGVILAILAGILILLAMFAGENAYISFFSLSDTMEQYTRDYYSVIVFYLCLNPLSALLDNTSVADGREGLSAFANIVEITGNIILSILLVQPFGIRGIALSSVLCKLVFFIIISIWAIPKFRELPFSLYLKLQKCRDIFRYGTVKASTYLFSAMTEIVLYLFAIKFFDGDPDTLELLSIGIELMGISTLFIGLSMAAQPLITTLCGEKNTRGLRTLMKAVSKTLFMIGIILSVIFILLAPFLARSFGLEDETLIKNGTFMMRSMGVSYALQAMTNLFFIYYFLMGKNMLALFISFLKEFLAPVLLSLLGIMILHSDVGIWLALAVAPVTAYALSMLIVRLRYGKDNFPWLVPGDHDGCTWFYYFLNTQENVVDLSETLVSLLDDQGCPKRTGLLAGTLVEDILLLIQEKNPPKKKVYVECTVLLEESEVRLILRDSGIIFDVMDQDSKVESLREYVVANELNLPQYKVYMTTTGYNRNQFSLKIGA